jgi:UvrD-like helicase C-terminal domain
VRASFDGRSVTYGFGELDALVPAYAATIHKSQGSEYPAVIIPVLTQHYPMLQRNLLYTGVTRGKRLVVLVGQKKAIAIAVRNVSGRRRWSKLDEWLRRGASRTSFDASKAGPGRHQIKQSTTHLSVGKSDGDGGPVIAHSLPSRSPSPHGASSAIGGLVQRVICRTT